jgi:hypothetical protein
MEDFLIFLIRFIPFWAIPVMMISIELARRFRTKDASKQAFFSIAIALLCLLATAFYFYAGGPDRAVELYKN